LVKGDHKRPVVELPHRAHSEAGRSIWQSQKKALHQSWINICGKATILLCVCMWLRVKLTLCGVNWALQGKL